MRLKRFIVMAIGLIVGVSLLSGCVMAPPYGGYYGGGGDGGGGYYGGGGGDGGGDR